MKRTLLEVYCLAVSFFSLAVIVYLLGHTLNSFYYYIEPEAAFDIDMAKLYESTQSYKERHTSLMLPGVKESELTFEQIEEKRKSSLEYSKEVLSKDAIQSVRYYGIHLVIVLFVFFSHWHFARKIHATNT